MNYQSTRNKDISVTAAQAIAQGISAEGGLFVPQSLPKLTTQRLTQMLDMGYQQRAELILQDFLSDYTRREISSCVSAAYTAEKFGSNQIAPLSKLSPNRFMLELWHGPTCAFKDMALQLLPHLLTTAVQKLQDKHTVVILVATSGDTGKAALAGFQDVPGTRVLVYYPAHGVSRMQQLQMATQEGENVGVFAIEGNFDDAQSAVKQIFTDDHMIATLDAHGYRFSSANSINWGRLLPQIVYYISGYCDLVADEQIALGDRVNVVVPTGNFGNILAAYYAKCMGLPLGKLICASNENHVLTDFITTGCYDRNRAFYTTISPSMDILISSNLERLLYDLYDGDCDTIAQLMQQLATTGRYQIADSVKQKLQQHFYAGYCDDARTKQVIADTFARYNYLCDTHTAVALGVYEDYRAQTGDDTPVMIASTANPYKFPASVLGALQPQQLPEDEFACAARLQQLTGWEMPASLQQLQQRPVRFAQVYEKQQITDSVLQALQIKD